MSGDALRSVFAEFGFAFEDTEKLSAISKKVDDIEKRLKGMASTVDETTEAADAGFAREGKAAEDAAAKTEKAAAKTKKAAKDAVASDGADKALKDVGDGFYRAFGERAAAGIEKLTPRLGAVARMLGLTGAKSEEFGRLIARVTGYAAAGIALVTAAAVAFARAFGEDVTALREAADAARVTEQQFQQLSFAGAAAGVSAETTAGGVNALAEGLRAIEARTGGPTNALWRLGVRARNVDGTMRDTNDVLLDLADRFERVRSPVHRARLAQELFGASGRRMLDVLRGGSAALRRQREDFAALGGGVLPEAVEEGRKFTMAQTRMRVALDSVRSVVATSLLPALTYVTNQVANLTGWFSRMTRGSNLLNVAFGAIGVAGALAAATIIAAWWPVIAPVAAAAAALAVILLVIDDVVTFLRGGNSVIGEFIDYLYGAGEAQQTLQYLPVLWRDITEWVDAATESVMKFLEKIGLADREAPALGRLRAPPGAVPVGGARVTTRRGIRLTSTTPTVDATPTAPAVPDYLAQLRYTPSVSPRGGARQVTTHNNVLNQFAITGVTDPQEVTRRVARLLEERQRQQRDREHPNDPED